VIRVQSLCFKTSMKQINKIIFTRFHCALILWLGIAARAFAQDPLDCQSCHGDKDLAVTDSAGVSRSLFVDAAQMEHSVHPGFDCVTCHADIKEIPHAERLAPAACGACHEDAITELAESVHGKSEASADAPTCGDCHGSHEIRGRADSLSWVNPRQLGFTCARNAINLRCLAASLFTT